MENTPNMPGKLDKMITYLAGGMEHAVSMGVEYRRRFIQKCKDRGLKIKFLDPTDKIMSLAPDVNVEKNRIEKYKREKNWDKLRRLMKTIVRQDLRQVDLSDMIVGFIDRSVFTCGTIEEIISAERQKKLVILIVAGGKEACPAWLFGIIHYNYIFDTEDEAIDYLVKMNNGTIPLDKKLILFRKELDELEV